MQDNLVIVESPAKAKTIEKFLGSQYLVKSSFGHIRDIAKSKENNLGVDVANNYLPCYEVSEDKVKVVSELRKLSKNAQTVWLASDEDREGEAIAWHLSETLNLDNSRTKRIVFHEITKDAILYAIQNPRSIDMNLVNAQQARRVLDRLVGFELSPLLWKKVKPSLSAGRVQSVAVRLIVEREREIIDFRPETFYRVTGLFEAENSRYPVKAELSQKFKDEAQALAFLEQCKDAIFRVNAIEKKTAKKTPAPPFTTSTLQQEASRKLGFSVSQTMLIAQRLYEAGLITYMRTDSVNLSELAVNTAREAIVQMYGEKYHHTRRFTTKTKGAQEAHEAIRPTYMQNSAVEGDSATKRLYNLIWKRTIASQMSDAALENTTIDITAANIAPKFMAKGEVLLFDGFLRVYLEGKDDEDEQEQEGMLPPLTQGQVLATNSITATQRFTQRPPRYTEASLVKKMEELGIGRPSTYAPTISTVIQRGYVSKEDREGTQRTYRVSTLAKGAVKTQTLSENTGAEKSKLFPSDVGMVVTDYLTEHFPKVMDYNFTAKVEEDFDEIAGGKIKWNAMIDDFYKPFHKTLEDAAEHSDRATAERILGTDPASGKPVLVRIGRFGPLAQIGGSDDENKRFANLRAGQLIETITMEEVLKLFELPRSLGAFEGGEVKVAVGRFGPYVRHNDKFISLKRNIDDPMTITLERAVELIREKREAEQNRIIKTFAENADLQVLNGRYGPYFACGGVNYKIAKTTDPKTLTYEQCCELMEAQKDTAKKSRSRRSAKAVPAKTRTTAAKTKTKATTIKKKKK